MELKWNYFFLVIIQFITFTKADKTTYLELIDSLHTLNILKGLEKNFNTNTSCKNDLEEFLTGLSSDEPWALKMYDSSAKLGDGFLLLPPMYLGQYDECLAIEHPQKNFTGQHCMIKTIIVLGNDSTLIPNIDNETKIIKTYAYSAEDSLKVDFYFGICLPSTCLRPEINKSLNQTKFKGNVSMGAPEYFCHTRETLLKSSIKYRINAWITIGILIFFTAVALTNTCYDVYQQKVRGNKSPRPLLTLFSLYKNGIQLFETKATEQLKMLNGIRVISILWVILHNGFVLLLYDQPLVDRIGVLKRFMDHNHIITTHGYIAVDSFFFLSGLLASFVFFQDMAKKGYYDVPLAYIHRYIRITPPYAVMILIVIFLFRHFGNGPIWDSTESYLSGPCEKNWVTAMLYLDNYQQDWKCIPPTWYLASDMQLHWISPLILYPLHFWPALASYILCAVVLLAGVTTFTNAYVNSLGPSIEISTNSQQWWLDYKPFHTRAAPWLIGLAVGYAICTIKARKINIRLTKIGIVIGWLASAGLCLGSLYGITSFTDFEYTRFEAALYLAFHRVGWGLGIAWIVFACVYGYGGPVNTFLSWSVFQPLGKLTYGAFLIHWPIQYYRIGISRAMIQGNDVEQMYYFLGDVVLSFLLAIPLALLFELPFRNMYKYFFRNVKILPFPRQTKQSEEVELKGNNIVVTESGEDKETNQFVK